LTRTKRENQKESEFAFFVSPVASHQLSLKFASSRHLAVHHVTPVCVCVCVFVSLSHLNNSKEQTTKKNMVVQIPKHLFTFELPPVLGPPAELVTDFMSHAVAWAKGASDEIPSGICVNGANSICQRLSVGGVE